MLTLTQQHLTDIVVCRAVGELDAFNVTNFHQALADVSRSRRLIVDLSGITFIDASGLGALVGGVRRVRDFGGDIAVSCSRAVLLGLFHSTGFDKIVTVVADLDQAVRALERRESA